MLSAMPKLLFSLGIAMMVATATTARADTEEPAFTVVEKIGVIDVRQYGPRLAAEVTVGGDEEDARSAGFRLLADYIFGNNTSRASIAMGDKKAQREKVTELVNTPARRAADKPLFSTTTGLFSH